MSNWEIKCKQCGHSFTFEKIKDMLENYYFLVKPKFPKEGLLRECPFCFSRLAYLPIELCSAPL